MSRGDARDAPAEQSIGQTIMEALAAGVATGVVAYLVPPLLGMERSLLLALALAYVNFAWTLWQRGKRQRGSDEPR